MPATLLHRRSIRIQGFDYAQPGSYFITICAWDKKLIFGKITNGEVTLSHLGEIARKELEKLPHRFTNINLDCFVVMPNHIHILITISNDGGITGSDLPGVQEAFKKPVPGSVPTIVRAYKAAVTQRVSALRNAPVSIVWHRNYYEHVVRNEGERERIFLYINSNPAQWDSDEENPVRRPIKPGPNA
jgi:putative transposase